MDYVMIIILSLSPTPVAPEQYMKSKKFFTRMYVLISISLITLAAEIIKSYF